MEGKVKYLVTGTPGYKVLDIKKEQTNVKKSRGFFSCISRDNVTTDKEYNFCCSNP